MKTILTAILLSVAFVGQAQTHTLTIRLGQFKTSTGPVFVTLQNPSQKAIQRQTVALRGNAAQAVFRNVARGTYAIRFYHDANNNQQFDKGLFGVPKEEWGCSNDVKAAFGPPKFEAMLFSLTTDKTLALHVN